MVKDLVESTVLGRDPARIEQLWSEMYDHSFWAKGGGAIVFAGISAIEQALWDIKGKALGVPVYELLGGRVRDKVRMYTHLGGGNMKSVYETFDVGPLIDLAHQVMEQGYSAVKVVFVPYSEPLEGIGKVKQFARLMEKLRESVGEQIDVMIDFHGRTYPAMAIEYIKAVAEFRPYFCEEPVPPENVEALCDVREKVRVPIATGERLVGRNQFRALFEQRACD